MHSNLQRQNFTAYLDQFIGQPKETILAEAEFKTFGFDATTSPQVQHNSTQLIYTIHRPLAIPIPMPAQATYTPGMGGIMNSGGMMPSSAQGGNAYEVQADCHIIFYLENNIATKWESKGKAC
ncbi:hypothetical protein ACNAUS_04245 [Acinetobacter puyangensis]